MIKKTLTAVLCTLLAPSAFSLEDDTLGAQLSFGWSPVITLSGGPMWTSPGKYQIIYYSDALGNSLYSSYYPNKNTSTQGIAELFFALQKEVIPGMTAQLGLEIAGATDADLQGQTAVNGIPDLYNYSYSINHMRIGAKGKLIANRVNFVQPYLSGAVAASYNQSHLFYSQPTSALTPYTPWYQNDTVIGFAFTIGAGVQKTFCNNWQFGLGYEFNSLGKSNLGMPSNYAYYPNGIGMRLGGWYAHQLQFSLSYTY